MRLLSVSKTIEQVRAGTKTVSRRVNWRHARVGMQLMLVEKGQGLKPGESIVRIRPVELIDVRREPLGRMVEDWAYGERECVLEGFSPPHPKSDPAVFCEFFSSFSGLTFLDDVTRLEWVYLDGGGPLR